MSRKLNVGFGNQPYTLFPSPIPYFSAVAGTGSASSGGGGGGGLPLLFSDNFASGGLSHTQNGVSWGASARTSVVANPNNTNGSTNVLQYSYDAGNQSEQRFTLGNGPYLELQLQFDILFPVGYADGTGTPTNNKVCRVWNGNTSDGNDGYSSFYIKAGASTIKGSGSTLNTYIQEYGSNLNGSGVGEFGNNAAPQPGPPYADAGNYGSMVLTSDLGAWMTWKIHFKCSTSANNDGVIETWKNGTQIISATNLPFYPSLAAQNGFTHGNILGFANTGFVNNPQLIYVTNVSIWGQ